MTILELLRDKTEYTAVQGVKTRLICSADGCFEVWEKDSNTKYYLIQHYEGTVEADAVAAFRVSEGLAT